MAPSHLDTATPNRVEFVVSKSGAPNKMTSLEKKDDPPLLDVRFINTNRPDVPGHLRDHRSSIHAHAARATHAKRRKRRQPPISAPQTSSDELPRQQEHADGHPNGFFRFPIVSATATPNPNSNTNTTSLATRDAIPVIHLAQQIETSTTLTNPLATPTEHFLLNHYITVVLPYMHSQCTKLKSRGQMYLDAMDSEWISLALYDTSFRGSVFLKASRHLSLVHPLHDQKEVYAHLATRYKRACMLRLHDAISGYLKDGIPRDESFNSDSLVALTLELAHDEILLGQMVTGRKHVEGAAEMVKMNGGSRTLGLNGFLETVFYKSMGEVGLLMQPAEPVNEENLFMSVL